MAWRRRFNLKVGIFVLARAATALLVLSPAVLCTAPAAPWCRPSRWDFLFTRRPHKFPHHRGRRAGWAARREIEAPLCVVIQPQRLDRAQISIPSLWPRGREALLAMSSVTAKPCSLVRQPLPLCATQHKKPHLRCRSGRAACWHGMVHSAQALKRKGDGTVPLEGAFRRAPWRPPGRHKNPHLDGRPCSRSMHGASLRRWVRTADRLRMRRSLVPAAHGARTALGRLTPAIGAQPSRAQETALFLVCATVGRPAAAMGNGPSRKPSKSMPLSVR